MEGIITLFASVFLVGAYLSYMWAIVRGEIPHPVTIGIWLAWVILNAITYSEVAGSMAQKFAIVQRACMFIIAALTVAVVLRRGWEASRRIIRFEKWDLYLGLGVMVAFLCKIIVDDPNISNAVAQAAILVSFVPMVKMAFAREQKMSPWPWSFGVAAYVLQFLVAWPDGLAALMYPIVGVVGHGVVWIGIRRKCVTR